MAAIALAPSGTKRRWPADELGTRNVDSRRSVSADPQVGQGGDGASKRDRSSKRASHVAQE
jgi:hypothetical protein